MILAVSRFRVVNGTEPEVRRAFEQRPRLVDDVPGFLGMETFTDSKDPSVFVLVTRWANAATFHVWHGSDAHGRSHALIPSGLKLDPAFTRVEVLERLDDPAGEAALEVFAADATTLVARLLSRTRTTHIFAGALDGTLARCNDVAAAALGVPASAVTGRAIWGFLVEPDQATLRALLASSKRLHADVRLNFVGPSGHPYTLECALEVGEGFTLLGDPPVHQERALDGELLRLNAELNVLARENARAKRELARALEDLRKSHWHVKKFQEVLPMCLECGRVRMADARWETPAKFLKQSTDFLSHGYCPECGERLKKLLEEGSL